MDRRLDAFERRYALPGLSGAATNRRIWETYDWSRAGEEWTSSPEWKQSLVDLIQERVPMGSSVLEDTASYVAEFRSQSVCQTAAIPLSARRRADGNTRRIQLSSSRLPRLIRIQRRLERKGSSWTRSIV